MRLACLAILAAVMPAQAAVIGGFDDLRLSLTYPGGKAKTTVESGGASATTTDAWDSANRINLDYVGGWSIPLIGVVVGAGVTADLRKDDTSTGSLEYQAYSGHVRAGPYWSLLETLNIELTGQIGYGLATIRSKAAGKETSDSGGYVEYGGDLTIDVAIPVVGLVVGVAGGYIYGGSKHDLDSGSGTSTAIKVINGNWTVTGLLGYRF